MASKVFCEMLRDLVKTTQHDNLRSKILELIQAWGFAFRNNQKYRAVQVSLILLFITGILVANNSHNDKCYVQIHFILFYLCLHYTSLNNYDNDTQNPD